MGLKQRRPTVCDRFAVFDGDCGEQIVFTCVVPFLWRGAGQGGGKVGGGAEWASGVHDSVACVMRDQGTTPPVWATPPMTIFVHARAQ